MTGNETDELVPTPEFERRCNAFVAAVEATIIPKYPDLGISAVNQTMDAIDPPHDLLEIVNALPLNSTFRQMLQGSITRGGDREDRLSAVEFTAKVSIYGWDGPTLVGQIREVIDKVDSLASQYQPAETDHDIDLDDADLPSAILTYVFR